MNMHLKNRYKLDILLGLLFLFLVVGVVLYPFYSWHSQSSKHLDVLIIDKTVANTEYKEDRALNWILNHQRYVKSTGEVYDYRNDYKSYLPTSTGDFTVREGTQWSTAYDVVYFADTYGVNEADFDRENSSGIRSELNSGGLGQQELDYIKQIIWNGATVIAEFNTFASPTSKAVREDITHLLGVHWTGWMGRYFKQLDETSDMPIWVFENYQNQYQRAWDYSGSGFIFVNEENQVVVLESTEDLLKEGNMIEFTEAGRAEFSLDRSAYYNDWFDVMEPREKTQVLAEYSFELSEQGKAKLNNAGIPDQFPAIMKYQTGLYQAYYFAGEYADAIKPPSFYKVAGLSKLQALIARNSIKSDDAFYWRVYTPVMERIFANVASERESEREAPELYINGSTKLLARTGEQFLQVYRGGSWSDFPVKGVNMGMATPGKWFTNFPGSEEPYLRWFEMIGEMEANTIRVYTLQHPAFYRALLQYNTTYPQKPLYLMQEIWPEEHPPEDDLLGSEYNREFRQEIEYVIDAIHGNAVIDERVGRAFGVYHADVSPYTIAYLVGRELEPHEVISTDKRNEGFIFEGEYLKAVNGSPTEAWFAMSCDYVLQYEQSNYGRQTPVAIVSWPTLDPLEHNFALDEDGTIYRDYNDIASVDINRIGKTDRLKAGFFGAYHIYPNYPDFINYKESYASYSDEEGILRYGGYLQEFMKQHSNHLALVAEFGIATGMGNAHYSPDGYHHGGLTEEEQGQGIVRMMKAIFREGYMGGLVFEWMDEWAKKTWTTEPFMIPYENHVFWHNAIDPEQNYGILALEAIKPKEPGRVIRNVSTPLEVVELRHNETFFFIDIQTKGMLDISKYDLVIGIDTYARDRGEFQLLSDPLVELPTGVEYKVKITGKDAQLLVVPSYNRSYGMFASEASKDGRFEEMKPLINKEYRKLFGTVIEQKYEQASKLRYGSLTGSTNHWWQDGDLIKLQIPWGRLNFTDPTNRMVLDDQLVFLSEFERNQLDITELGRDQLQITKSDGIVVYALILDSETNEVIANIYQEQTKPYVWDNWGEPTYVERLKDSYWMIRDYFKFID